MRELKISFLLEGARDSTILWNTRTTRRVNSYRCRMAITFLPTKQVSLPLAFLRADIHAHI